MFFLTFALSIGAVAATWTTGVRWIAIAVAVVAFWAMGIAANYRTDRHKMPNSAALSSIASAVASAVLIIVGLTVRWRTSHRVTRRPSPPTCHARAEWIRANR